jgi:hypothetical protein
MQNIKLNHDSASWVLVDDSMRSSQHLDSDQANSVAGRNSFNDKDGTEDRTTTRARYWGGDNDTDLYDVLTNYGVSKQEPKELVHG